MKALFLKYKTVIRFLGFFFGSYLLLSFFYNLYLKQSQSDDYSVDFITHLVAEQTVAIVETLGYRVQLVPHESEPAIRVIVEQEYVANIVEGCNAVSVIILFVTFVVAFAQRLKPTLLFLFSGAVLIYALNIIRIALFVISLKTYPQYKDFLHDIAFPGVIYGVVFILWFFWVKRIPNKKNSSCVK